MWFLTSNIWTFCTQLHLPTNYNSWPLSSCICAVRRSSAFFKDISAAGVRKAKRWLFFVTHIVPVDFQLFLSESKCENFTGCTNQKSSHQTVSLLAQRNYSLKESFTFQNLIQDFQLYQASLNKSLLLKKKNGEVQCWWRESNLPMRASQFNWFHYMVY